MVFDDNRVMAKSRRKPSAENGAETAPVLDSSGRLTGRPYRPRGIELRPEIAKNNERHIRATFTVEEFFQLRTFCNCHDIDISAYVRAIVVRSLPKLAVVLLEDASPTMAATGATTPETLAAGREHAERMRQRREESEAA